MQDVFGEFLRSILNSGEFQVAILGAVLAFIGWLGKKGRELVNSRITAEQLQTLIRIAQEAVKYAEQTGAAKTGEEKKAQALAVAQTFLDLYGIKASAAQIEAAIEAAVFSEITQFQPLELVTTTPQG